METQNRVANVMTVGVAPQETNITTEFGMPFMSFIKGCSQMWIML